MGGGGVGSKPKNLIRGGVEEEWTFPGTTHQ